MASVGTPRTKFNDSFAHSFIGNSGLERTATLQGLFIYLWTVRTFYDPEFCNQRCKQRKKSQETDDDGLVVLHEYCGILCYHASQKAVTLPTAVTPFAPPSAENTVSLRRENLSFPFMQRSELHFQNPTLRVDSRSIALIDNLSQSADEGALGVRWDRAQFIRSHIQH